MRSVSVGIGCGGAGVGGWRVLICRPQAAFEALISSHHIVRTHPLVQQGAENSPCNMVPSLSPLLSRFLSPNSELPVPELSDWQPTGALCLLGEESGRSREQTGQWKRKRERGEKGESDTWTKIHTMRLLSLSVSSIKRATSQQKTNECVWTVFSSQLI